MDAALGAANPIGTPATAATPAVPAPPTEAAAASTPAASSAPATATATSAASATSASPPTPAAPATPAASAAQAGDPAPVASEPTATAETVRLPESVVGEQGIQSGATPPPPPAPGAPTAAYATAGPGAGAGASPTGHGRTVSDFADRLDDTRFFSSLFDFTFTNYVTRKLAGPVYVVGLVLIGLSTLLSLVYSLTLAIGTHSVVGAFVFLFGVIITLVGAMLSVLLLRVGIEVFVAIIEIAQNTRKRSKQRD
ncbi:hypothetical protein ASE16_08640 [Leifsonia sp. Root227]|nr:hypothetical protein ASE16_08640 [Leifsonia sp. Root227]